MSEHIKIYGRVKETAHEIYIIEGENGSIKATLSGKLRFNKIQILLGDIVEVRISPYDLSHGQIIRRLDGAAIRRLNLKF